VVVVTLNHRLGAFGFLNLADLGGETFADSGNAGMLDIVAALTWVRDNIAGFGGDPGNVTVFGESGGGAKVSVLMAMPSAKGLFHRAIIQSGPAVEMMAPTDAGAVTRKMLELLGLDPARPKACLAALMEVPAAALMAAQTAVLGVRAPGGFANRRKEGFNPVIDGRNLPGGPFVPTAPKISADVPLMIGTNKDEMALFWSHAPWLEGLTEQGLDAAATLIAGEPGEAAARHYRKVCPNAAPRDIIIAIGTDLGMRLPSLVMADRKCALQAAPVFVYLFTWETPVVEGRLKSAHVLEIPFVFGTIDRASSFTGTSPDRLDLAARMRRTWAQFARTGTPNGPGLPTWPAYDTSRRPTMIFDEEQRVENDPLGSERAFWNA
jgi:para-nitrobenzyl esterase